MMHDSALPRSTLADRSNPAEELARLWDQGQRPDVDAFLAQRGPLGADRLAAVLREDQRQRWRAGQPTFAESYLDRFPQLRADFDGAVDLIFNEFLLLEKNGQVPSVDDYLRRFPEYADVLTAQVGLHRAMMEEGPSGTAWTAHPEKSEAGSPKSETQVSEGDSDFGVQQGEAEPKGDLPPRAFGRYEIIQKIGQGAMGTVYLARDTQLDRRVALKVPRLGSDRSLVERFYREAKIAATFTHPCLCPVYDVGQINGLHYLTMPYIQGEPFSAWLRREGLLPSAQAAALISQIARAVHVAHQAGVVHRDLKPANVMITDRQEPMVMDWGLARRSAADDPRVTASGMIIGTPAYLAPEQIGGESAVIGPAADIYSLGVMLFEMLTGRLPFQGTPGEILRQSLIQEPEPPSRGRPDLDPRFDSICLRALAKNRQARFASMAEFADALDACLTSPASQSVSAGCLLDGTSTLVSRSNDGTSISTAHHSPLSIRRRHRRILIALAALAVLLLVGLVGWTVFSRVSDPVQVGSQWKGHFRFLPPVMGYTGDIRVTVKERKGNIFKGAYATEDGKYEWEIEGTVDHGAIRWEFTRIVREKEPTHVVDNAYVEGRYEGRNMEVRFRHPYDNSEAELLLVQVK